MLGQGDDHQWQQNRQETRRHRAEQRVGQKQDGDPASRFLENVNHVLIRLSPKATAGSIMLLTIVFTWLHSHLRRKALWDH